MRRIVTSDKIEPLLKKLNIQKVPALVAVNRDLSVVEVLEGEATRKGWQGAIKNFIWAKSKELSVKIDKVSEVEVGGKDVSLVEQTRVANKKGIINRRYKVHMSDLEKTILYAVS